MLAEKRRRRDEARKLELRFMAAQGDYKAVNRRINKDWDWDPD